MKRYVALRDEGVDPLARARRARIVDPFVEKIEELVERSGGRIRADVVHARLVALGFAGDERTTRRAVAEAKRPFEAGHRRVYRPWMPEPGLWLQWDWGEGPRIDGRRTSVGGVRYSVPYQLIDETVWVRFDGDDLVVVHAWHCPGRPGPWDSGAGRPLRRGRPRQAPRRGDAEAGRKADETHSLQAGTGVWARFGVAS